MSLKMRLIYMLAVLVAAGVSACNEHISPESGNYFPIETSNEWNYQRWIIDWQSKLPQSVFDTMKTKMGSEVVVDGKRYKEIIDHDGSWNKIVRVKIVRVEGSKYYVRNQLYNGDFSPEYVFLDTDKRVGESWYYIKSNVGYSKAEYIILEKGSKVNVLGVAYDDVIKVQVNYYQPGANGTHVLWISSIHYYAKGIGEIYNFYPYPASFTYADLGGFMIPTKK